MTPFVGLIGHASAIENTAIILNNRNQNTLNDVSEIFYEFFEKSLKIISFDINKSEVTDKYKSPIYDIYQSIFTSLGVKNNTIPMQITRRSGHAGI